MSNEQLLSCYFDQVVCTVDNSLFPIDPPSVVALEPVLVAVNYSQMANFTCQAYGIPVPSLQWVKEIDGGVTVNVTDTIKIFERIVAPSTMESVLIFENTTKIDESLYWCKGSNGVTNIINSSEVDFVTLFVDGMVASSYNSLAFPFMCSHGMLMLSLFLVAVDVLEDPRDITHFAGGSIDLTCTVFGDFNLSVVWFKNDTLISEDVIFTITNSILEETPNGIIVQSFLSIAFLNLTYDADYFCQGFSYESAFGNILQHSSASAHVTVQC